MLIYNIFIFIIFSQKWKFSGKYFLWKRIITLYTPPLLLSQHIFISLSKINFHFSLLMDFYYFLLSFVLLSRVFIRRFFFSFFSLKILSVSYFFVLKDTIATVLSVESSNGRIIHVLCYVGIFFWKFGYFFTCSFWTFSTKYM